MTDAKKYTLCEAPVCVGSPTSGTEEAYSYLLEHGVKKIFEKNAYFADFTSERTKKAELCDPRLIELETVVHVCKELLKNQRRAFEKGTFPITVGGDHSIVMSSVSALSEVAGACNTAVIYIDGHTDINTEKTTFTGRIHGMPLAETLGICTELLDIGCKNKPALYGKNLYIIGAHSIDDAEYVIMKEHGVHLYTPEDVARRGVDVIACEVLKATEGKMVHLSFDVDSIDGAEFTSTGYVMPGGLPYKTVYSFLQMFISSGRLSSFDCVEYNPSLDKAGNDLIKLLDIFNLFE